MFSNGFVQFSLNSIYHFSLCLCLGSKKKWLILLSNFVFMTSKEETKTWNQVTIATFEGNSRRYICCLDRTCRKRTRNNQGKIKSCDSLKRWEGWGRGKGSEGGVRGWPSSTQEGWRDEWVKTRSAPWQRRQEVKRINVTLVPTSKKNMGLPATFLHFSLFSSSAQVLLRCGFLVNWHSSSGLSAILLTTPFLLNGSDLEESWRILPLWD